MARKHRRWWKRTGNVLIDHIVCPRCGANATGASSGHKLSCECGGGKCFAMESGELTWRRSPCHHAECSCGWKGSIRSTEFESVYHRSRCRVSSNGWHDVGVSVYKNENPGPLTIELRCKACGCRGHKTIDAVGEVAWEDARKKEDCNE